MAVAARARVPFRRVAAVAAAADEDAATADVSAVAAAIMLFADEDVVLIWRGHLILRLPSTGQALEAVGMPEVSHVTCGHMFLTSIRF